MLSMGYTGNVRDRMMANHGNMGTNGHLNRRIQVARRSANSTQLPFPQVEPKKTERTSHRSDAPSEQSRAPMPTSPQRSAKAAEAVTQVMGRVLINTQVYVLGGDNDVQTLADGILDATETKTLPANTRIICQYPMVRLGTQTAVLMRTPLVDSVTATLSHGWVMVYEERQGKPVRYVADWAPL